jgi:hypothetical protein
MRYILVILAVISLHSSAESINDCASLKGDAHYRCLAMATLSANECDRIANYSDRVACVLAVTKESRRVRNLPKSS